MAEPDPATGGTTEMFWSVLRTLRTTCPVARSDAQGGFWVVTAHDDVVRVLQDWRTFTSTRGVAPVAFDDGGLGFRLLPAECDPPYHRSFRKLLNPPFGPEALAAIEEDTRAIAIELIDGFASRGSCEFMSEFAVAFPSHVLFRTMLGLPIEALDDVLKWVDRLVMEPDAAMEVLMELMPWCHQTLETRRSEPRRDDVLDVLIHGRLDGERPLDELEQVEAFVLLIVAGLETTANAFGNIVMHLATDPDLRHRVEALPDVGKACDEFLRYEAPAPGMGRTATCDTVLGRQPIKAGDRVVVYYGGANRDPAVWADPDALDVERSDAARHISFGSGPHRCVGMHLARLELRIGVAELLRRLPGLRLDPAFPLVWRNAFSRGPARLQLTFHTAGFDATRS
jgi:cytochrome P450